MAQKPHTPTDDTRKAVSEYATNGVDQDSIAAAIGISDETLRKYYRTELNACAGVFKADFASSIGRDVRRFDCPPALRIFAAKVKLGWRETVAIDPTKEHAPAELTDEQLAAIVSDHAKRARSQRSAGDAPAKTRAA